MKTKTLFYMCLWLAFFAVLSTAWAAPSLTAGSATIVQGETATLRLGLTGGDSPYAGVNARVLLPKGIVPTGVSKGGVVPTTFKSDWHTYPTDQGNVVTCITYSESETITASAGEVFVIALKAELSASPGISPLEISTSGLSNTDGSVSVAHGTVKGSLTCEMSMLDADGDGMPDSWEIAHGLNVGVNDASLDADGDGYTNLQEYQHGKDPDDPLSKPGGPTADAGPDQQTTAMNTVKLSAANSTDPDDGIQSYLWEQVDGPAVTLSDASAVEPSFTAPEMLTGDASLLFRLTVTDQSGLKAQDTCIVNVTGGNEPPIADAGQDQTVYGGNQVVLDASKSHDGDGAIQSIQWTQLSGVAIILTSPETATPSFTAPDSWEGALTFLVTVADNGGLKAHDICIVNVTSGNTAPAAAAGQDIAATGGKTVSLDGSASSDAEGSITYRWTQTKGVPVTLTNPQAIAPSFVVPNMGMEGGKLEFRLTVMDEGGLKSQDRCTVTVGGLAGGSLQVTLTPQDAIDEGARWNVDGGEWKESGATVMGLEPGVHSVGFIPLPGWSTPVSQDIVIEAEKLTYTSAVYTMPSQTKLVLPQTNAAAGAEVQIPVSIESVSNLYAAELTIAFDPHVISLQQVYPGSLTSGWFLAFNASESGKITIALSGIQPIDGSGDLVVLDFIVTGKMGTFTALTFENTSLDEGRITPRLSHGLLQVESFYSISGACAYYKNGMPIPGVALSLTGDGSYLASSDGTGSFVFSEIPMGGYRLTPTKSDGVGSAISALDASFVLRHVVGLAALDANQLIAGDVNQSGTVSALDASFILRKTVGLIDLPFVPGGKIWVFKPEQKSYEPLTANQTAENFAGILLGDVNGNWTTPVQTSLVDSSASRLASAATAPTTGVQEKIPALDGRARLSAGAALRLGADEVSVPLKLQVLKGEVYAGELLVAYDAKRFQLTDVKAGPLAKEALLSYQEQSPGIVRIALASATPIRGMGDLATLQFKRKGSKLWNPVVQVRKTVLNDGMMKTLP